MPKVDLRSPKLDLSTPKLHVPDLDVDAPSGKFKMPKLNLSGTLPNGPNLDMNADVNSPDLNLKAPKIKGGIDGPDLDLPKVDLKTPKVDVCTPGVNIGSPKTKLKMPKLKMPKFSFPSLKGPEIDGNFDGPDVDINVPNINLKGPKADLEMPDVGISGPSGKLKKPNMNLPDLGLSGPKLDEPNLGFKSPNFDATLPKGGNLNVNAGLKTSDVNLKAPKIKGGLPAPTVDINAPDFNTGLPDSKLKMPKLKAPKYDTSSPKGPSVNMNADLQGPHINIQNVDLDGPKGKTKMQSVKTPDVNLSGPKVKTSDINLLGPKLKGPGVSLPNVDLPNASLKGPKLDLSTKHPDLGINSNIEGPDMNFATPQVKKGIQGPDIHVNVPSGDIQGPQADLDLDRKFKLPSFKLPQFGSTDLSRTGSDIDFGASMIAANLDSSPPNAKLNMKPPQLVGSITDPKVRSPNIELSIPKADIRNPHLQLKATELDIDDPSFRYKRPSYKNHKSDITGVNLKTLALDIDRDVRLHHTDRKSSKSKARASYPLVDSDLGDKIDFSRSDLNIDDFTGKDHILRARGSTLDLQASNNHGQGISTSSINVALSDHRHRRQIPAGDTDINTKHHRSKQPATDAHLPNVSRDLRQNASDAADGYYVTVFPTKSTKSKNAQNPKMTNCRYNTLGGLDFNPGNVDLEVPDENDLKGSTFFFSSLI
ncbi:hypothetical protein LDENG_00062990 [Lucifuga dentata]|nr:hypothetical protein LDENG_00062990 [Lucifuga dentata]